MPPVAPAGGDPVGDVSDEVHGGPILASATLRRTRQQANADASTAPRTTHAADRAPRASRSRRDPRDHVGHRARPGHPAADQGLLGVPRPHHRGPSPAQLRRVPRADPFRQRACRGLGVPGRCSARIARWRASFKVRGLALGPSPALALFLLRGVRRGFAPSRRRARPFAPGPLASLDARVLRPVRRRVTSAMDRCAARPSTGRCGSGRSEAISSPGSGASRRRCRSRCCARRSSRTTRRFRSCRAMRASIRSRCSSSIAIAGSLVFFALRAAPPEGLTP